MLNIDKKTWTDRKHLLWWPISFTKYRIENGRIYLTTGLFSTKEEECLLYRIMDITYERTMGNKICGTGTIRLTTKDASNPYILLENIKDSQQVKDVLSSWIEEERTAKRVVGRDMYGASSHIDDDDLYDE
jgi:uncharacterized membrane protein YdbT with pleckstrin-like domain